MSWILEVLILNGIGSLQYHCSGHLAPGERFHTLMSHHGLWRTHGCGCFCSIQQRRFARVHPCEMWHLWFWKKQGAPQVKADPWQYAYVICYYGNVTHQSCDFQGLPKYLSPAQAQLSQQIFFCRAAYEGLLLTCLKWVALIPAFFWLYKSYTS